MKSMIRRWLGLEDLYLWSKYIKAEFNGKAVSHEGKRIEPTTNIATVSEESIQTETILKPEVVKGYDATLRRPPERR